MRLPSHFMNFSITVRKKIVVPIRPNRNPSVKVLIVFKFIIIL
jgi:hypothetical protein